MCCEGEQTMKKLFGNMFCRSMALVFVFILNCACAFAAHREDDIARIALSLAGVPSDRIEQKIDSIPEKGEKGAHILQIKKRMQELGYFKPTATLSSEFNDTMVERMKMFQTNNGLNPTGRYDVITELTMVDNDNVVKGPWYEGEEESVLYGGSEIAENGRTRNYKVKIPHTPSRITFSHPSGKATARLDTGMGYPYELQASNKGSDVMLYTEPAGEYSLEVDASGAWSMNIEELYSQRLANMSGKGPFVSELLEFDERQTANITARVPDSFTGSAEIMVYLRFPYDGWGMEEAWNQDCMLAVYKEGEGGDDYYPGDPVLKARNPVRYTSYITPYDWTEYFVIEVNCDPEVEWSIEFGPKETPKPVVKATAVPQKRTTPTDQPAGNVVTMPKMPENKQFNAAVPKLMMPIKEAAKEAGAEATSTPPIVKGIEQKRYGDYIYMESVDICIILKYTGNDVYVDIPSRMDGNQVVTVGGFEQCRELISVRIPYGTTRIEERAFYDCDNLIDVSFPRDMMRIRGYAFAECDKLETIIIPDGLLRIEDCAFYNCRSLKQIRIPDSVELIGKDAFKGCDKLERIIGKTGTVAEEVAKEIGVAFVAE